MKKLLLFIFVLFRICGYSQTDSLKFKNTNIVVGEVTSLINGVITMKTSFSDKDFKIEYKEVEEIYLNQTFLINLANGGHYLGKVRSIRPEIILIADEKGYSFETNIKNLTQLKASGIKIWDRFKGRITSLLGIGKYVVSSNRLYLGIRTGLNYNVETYFDPTLDKNSTETNLNYDNQPAAIGNEFYYVLNSGFGWELK